MTAAREVMRVHAGAALRPAGPSAAARRTAAAGRRRAALTNGRGRATGWARATGEARATGWTRATGWARVRGRMGIGFVIGGTAAGLLVTLLASRGPGTVLSIFLLAGTAAGALAVRPRAAYLLIPVPALAYLAAATLAGLVHDRAADSSHTALAISAARWIASGFLAMTTATLLAIVMAVVRWAVGRRRPGLNH